MERRTDHWELQLDMLVDAYLQYYLHEGENLEPEPEEGTDTVGIEVVDLLCEAKKYVSGRTADHPIVRKQSRFPVAHEDKYTNVSLVRHGFLGSSPLYPTVAISLRTLAVYRQTHRVCPRYSLQSEAQKLCHLHHVCH
jgi:hypothetical protein